MIGDKIHNAPGDYQQRMRSALDTEGVTWHGGHSREDALRLAASCDIGLSWRHPELDASLELSTKVLEYGAIGLPVILNRTPMHEGLLGADYPLFAASLADVVDVAAAAAADPPAVPAGGRPDQPGRPAVHPGPGGGAAARLPGPRATPRGSGGKVAHRRGGSGGRVPPGGRQGGLGGSSPREQAQGRGGRARPEVLHSAAGLPAAAAGPGGAAGPVGRAGQARRGRQPGTGGLGRRGDLRMVRAERRLVQQAQAARVTAAGPAAPVRAGVALPGARSRSGR